MSYLEEAKNGLTAAQHRAKMIRIMAKNAPRAFQKHDGETSLPQSKDKNDSSSRQEATSSTTRIYKSDTPGEGR